jgi:hypothetical protein
MPDELERVGLEVAWSGQDYFEIKLRRHVAGDFARWELITWACALTNGGAMRLVDDAVAQIALELMDLERSPD